MVLFKTSKGDFKVKLNAEDFPLTVSNFLENIKKNIYTNQKFYKIINYSQIKIIHAGIHHGEDNFLEKNQTVFEVSKQIPLEIKVKTKSTPLYYFSIKDPSKVGSVRNSFQRGSIAMVKSDDRKSSSTEFFFVTGKIPELNGRYSIFGKIVRGLEILEKIEKKDMLYEAEILN